MGTADAGADDGALVAGVALGLVDCEAPPENWHFQRPKLMLTGVEVSALLSTIFWTFFILFGQEAVETV